MGFLNEHAYELTALFCWTGLSLTFLCLAFGGEAEPDPGASDRDSGR